jgi:hypothetical protein
LFLGQHSQLYEAKRKVAASQIPDRSLSRKSVTLHALLEDLTLQQLSLFAGEFLEAGGDTLNFEWVVKGKLSSGKYCDAEGFASP